MDSGTRTEGGMPDGYHQKAVLGGGKGYRKKMTRKEEHDHPLEAGGCQNNFNKRGVVTCPTGEKTGR